MCTLYMRRCFLSLILHLCVRECVVIVYMLIERNPPPGGGFQFTMFPHQEPCVRGPPSKNLEQILRGGSSYTRFLIREHSNRKHPWEGGVLSINVYVCVFRCTTCKRRVCSGLLLHLCVRERVCDCVCVCVCVCVHIVYAPVFFWFATASVCQRECV